MINSNEVCILLTGCMKPSCDVYSLAISDYEVRKRQYEDALKFYILNSRIKRIVYCDNSNEYPNEDIIQLAKKNHVDLEWINFEGDEKTTVEYGKGYGEGEIIKYAFSNSKLIQSSKWTIKITGRLIVKNINWMLVLSNNTCISINVYELTDKTIWADTKLFLVNNDVYKKYFMDLYKTVNDRKGYALESAYGWALFEFGLPYRMLPMLPNIKGISGSTGTQYDSYCSGVRHTIKILGYIFKTEPSVYDVKELDDEIIISDAEWEDKYSFLNRKTIVIYGAGKFGRFFYRSARKRCKVKAWVDGNYMDKRVIYGKRILPPDFVKKVKAEYIVVAVKSEKAFDEISQKIKAYNCDAQVIWMNKRWQKE